MFLTCLWFFLTCVSFLLAFTLLPFLRPLACASVVCFSLFWVFKLESEIRGWFKSHWWTTSTWLTLPHHHSDAWGAVSAEAWASLFKSEVRMWSAAAESSPLLRFQKYPLSSCAHDQLANKIPAHLKCLVSPIHLSLIPPLTSVLEESMSVAQERKTHPGTRERDASVVF